MTKPEKKRPLDMVSGEFSGFVLDPAQCSQLSMGEKRELIREIAQRSEDATEILSSFTRRELLEIICAEMGKERKYSGYTKLRMIEHLLKLVSQKSKRSNINDIIALSPAKTEAGFKRQRKKESQLQLSTDTNLVYEENNKEEEEVKLHVCQNIACKATLSPGDAFCKRCSCCICHYYDDNKDPSLWLTCGSDSLDEKSCGLTCHLICALKNEGTGIMKTGCHAKLDGSFYCVSCGKINGLMRTWKKQLLIAQEARRVDALCLRVLLGYKILTGTQQYKEMQNSLETALELLKKELGPLDLVYAKMARGIVKRLSCGAEVQKLCASAVEAFDSAFSDCSLNHVKKVEPTLASACQIRFEESSPTSVFVVLEYIDNLSEDLLGCMLWHRGSTVKDYPHKPTHIILKPEKKFKITGLTPSTEYCCKASFFGSTGILNVLETKWNTPTSNDGVTALGESAEEEDSRITRLQSQVKSANSRNIKLIGDHSTRSKSLKYINQKKNERSCSLPASTEVVSSISIESLSPSTPCKSSEMQDVSALGCKKHKEESAYEYSVRVVKWLESKGHIVEDFRVKFLTWFSLKATMQERRVVNVFVEALIDDPPSLAGQLIHSFTDEICSERKTTPEHGFCTRNSWHATSKEGGLINTTL
ncbi:VIN3-like protein 1 [Ricinus communis]|uniref:VIN3-like protein 1 n=1 Tax=Ricinus communis TaxID=3988 RepID=UPI00201AC195|nr:VIN3-like protein 1 [Ricinus communis]